MSLLRTPPLSLYVHLPWCVRKCPYCDFNSHALEGRVPEERYVAALLLDLQSQAPEVAEREILSIFLGGGTPSLFSPAALARLLDGVRRLLRVATDAEVTMEANPGTIEHGRFADYRRAGITRVSLGGQSFNAQHLQRLGRIHGSEDTCRAVDELAAAGIDNFNIDLMYGLPEQTVEQAVADVETAISLRPAHLSHYQLTLEPGTVFFHRPPPLPDDDASWQMQRECQELLAASGYEQYEISGYARSGRQCRHNLNYWQFGDYLGIGAGAHGKVTDAMAGRIWRTTVVRQPRQYLQAWLADDRDEGARAPAAARLERQVVAPEDLPFEFMLNALRLPSGFTRRQFEERTGLPLARIEPTLAAVSTRGLLSQRQADHWQPTALGLRFLNDLQASFLAEAPPRHAAEKANSR